MHTKHKMNENKKTKQSCRKKQSKQRVFCIYLLDIANSESRILELSSHFPLCDHPMSHFFFSSSFFFFSLPILLLLCVPNILLIQILSPFLAALTALYLHGTE